MKIFVTGTRGIPGVMGGVETHCEELFPRLASMGFDVTVARRRNYVSDGLTEWRGVRLVDIESPKRKSFEAIIHTFRAINAARRMRADVVHIHAVGPALLVPYAKMLGLRVVFTHHGPDYDRDKWGAAAKAMLRLGERMGCMFADDVIVISDVIRGIIRRKYGRTRRVHLIYNGVSEPELCDCPEYFKELGIEKGRYILGMCRFVPEKNLHHLVSAYAQIKNYELRVKKDSGIKLVLAGDADFEDDYSRRLKQMAKDNGVVLTGFIKGERLNQIMTNAALFVLPSTHEGLPISLLEAMSYDLDVLVSDIPANKLPELEEKDFFRCRDIQSLADSLSAKLSENRVGRTYDLSNYDWDNIAVQTMSVYQKVVSSK